MSNNVKNNERRKFIKGSALLTAGLISAPLVGISQPSPTKTADSIYIIGPQEGYSPQIGTLLSTMTMMREWLIKSVDFKVSGSHRVPARKPFVQLTTKTDCSLCSRPFNKLLMYKS